jgi:hypothetical protein
MLTYSIVCDSSKHPFQCTIMYNYCIWGSAISIDCSIMALMALSVLEVLHSLNFSGVQPMILSGLVNLMPVVYTRSSRYLLPGRAIVYTISYSFNDSKRGLTDCSVNFL